MTEYTVIVEQSDDWIGWIEEIPGVNCQESSREALLTTLRITLAEALEFSYAVREKERSRGDAAVVSGFSA